MSDHNCDNRHSLGIQFKPMKTTIKLLLIAFVLGMNILGTSLIIIGETAAGSIINGFLVGGLFGWATQERSKKIYAIALTKPYPHGGHNLMLFTINTDSLAEAQNEAIKRNPGYEIALAIDHTVKL